MARVLAGLIAVLMLVAGTAPAMAHHGWSEYDASHRMTMTGTISELHFANPHVTIVVKSGDTVWNVMLETPSRMKNRGCSAEMLNVGREITIEGLPHKTAAHEFRAERITLDGKTIELR